MRKRVFILISFVLFFTTAFRAQCPDRKFLLNYFRDSTELPSGKQLAKLLPYLDSMNACPYRNDSVHALLFWSIGWQYYLENDFLKALQYYHQFINIIRTQAGKSSIDQQSLIKGFWYLSKTYESLNMVTEKMKALDSCVDISEKLNFVNRATLAALNVRVEYYFDVGDYYRCIDYAARGETLAIRYANVSSGNEYWAGIQWTFTSLLWRVKALLILKDYKSAEELLANKLDDCKKAGLKNYLGTIYTQLAELELHKKNVEKALSFYKQALFFERQAGYNFSCKQIMNNVGEVYFKQLHDADRALSSFRNAFKYINKDKTKKNPDTYESLNIFANMGNIFLQECMYDSAFKYFQFAFDQIKPGINETDVLRSSPEEMIRFSKIHYLTSLIISKGDAYRKQYESSKRGNEIQKALRTYKDADKFLDRIKNEQTEENSKLFWRSDTRRLYENAIEASYLSGNTDDAFYFFEKSRAVLLNDQLNEQHWLAGTDILKQTQLKKKILRLERMHDSTNKSSPHYSELGNELFSSKQELVRLQELIKSNNPLYYQSFLDTNLITVKDVQQKILKDHQALVELFSGDSAVYIQVITAQKSWLKKINKAAFDSLSGAYTHYISHPDLLNKNFDKYIQLSWQLYHLIFQNVNLPAGRIIISPYGKYFPFEALVTNNQPLTYFVEDHAVSYTYSARYLLMNFTSSSSPSAQTFMGFAPVQFTRRPALTGSDQSLIRMKNYFSNAISFVGDKASKNNFLQEFYKHKIIQLYTHATDSGSTGEPIIYFSDSPLLLSDLLPEKKPVTSLIVLSACETAGGKLYNGEGVFSFNRQFAALGIPSSVCNLWQVDNRSTYKLTELFYKYVAAGMPLDLALQKAKKELSKNSENKLPYYWAASILVGQTNAVHTQDSLWKWLGLIILLLILGFWNERKWFK
jgi:CHAT domain-containing protein